MSFSSLIGSLIISTYTLIYYEWQIRFYFGHRGKNKLFSDFVFRNLEERSFAFGKADSDRDRSRLWRFESVEHDVDFEIELPSKIIGFTGDTIHFGEKLLGKRDPGYTASRIWL